MSPRLASSVPTFLPFCRAGWVVELLVGLLQPDPSRRLKVSSACAIVREALERGQPTYRYRPRPVRRWSDVEDSSVLVDRQIGSGSMGPQTSGSDAEPTVTDPTAASESTSPAVSSSEAAQGASPAVATPESAVAVGAGDSALEGSDASSTRRGAAAEEEAAVKAKGAANDRSDASPPSEGSSKRARASAQGASPSSSPQQGAENASSGGSIRDDAPRTDLSRFRKLARKDSSGEPFRSLEAMLNIGCRGGAYVVMQSRPWPGVTNYGEVIGFRNRADGDRWDIFAPGVGEELPPEEPYRIAGVLGVVLIKGGNHKLAVELEQPHAPLSKERVAEDVRTFVRVYGETHPGTSKARVRYLALDEFELDF